MNRFEYADPILIDGENTVAVENNVRLYDGDPKTSYEEGELIVTTHRILWGKPGFIDRGEICLSLKLSNILFVEEEPSSAFNFSRSRKVAVFLTECTEIYLPPDAPHTGCNYNFVKLLFREGFTNAIPLVLNKLVQKKTWETSNQQQQQALTTGKSQQPTIKLRSGIVGIERSLQEKQKATDQSISIAFQDLNKLMTMAKDMVRLSTMISTKIKDKQGDITEDETVRFKSYLLSLGIDDPVTRDAYKSDNQYYRSLALQISDFILPQVQSIGGMIALTDVFCRVNRARSLELLSPEDLLNACKIMESLDLPVKLYQFSSGVMVLQLSSLDTEAVAEDTASLIKQHGCLTVEDLSHYLGISLALAKERLLCAEKNGKACRDDAIEGVRYYENYFLKNKI